MRLNLLAVAICMLLVGGCRTEEPVDPEKDVIGKWRHDGITNSPKSVLKETMEFRPDGEFRLTTGGNFQYPNGKWKVTEKSGKTLSVELTYDRVMNDGQPSPQKVLAQLTFESRNLFLKKLPLGSSSRFVRE